MANRLLIVFCLSTVYRLTLSDKYYKQENPYDISELLFLRTNEHFEPPDPADKEVLYEKDIIVIPNHFPKALNFFCYPHNDLIRDRLCFGEIDAFAIACPEDNPPMQLVPFCLAFKNLCKTINYPSDEMCENEYIRYRRFCTHSGRRKCKSCHYDLTCACEPYECLWRRYGFATAKWCQRYELFCDEKKRRQKGNDLLAIIEESPRIHYRCMHMFNLPKVICDPFRRQYDYQRCMKFLFDCELVSDFGDESKNASLAGQDSSKTPEHTLVIDVSGGQLPLPAAPPEKVPNSPVVDPGLTKEILENDKQVIEALKAQQQLDAQTKLKILLCNEGGGVKFLVGAICMYVCLFFLHNQSIKLTRV